MTVVPFGPLLARRSALAIGDSVLKYESTVADGEIALFTSPKMLAKWRIFEPVQMQYGYLFKAVGESDVSLET